MKIKYIFILAATLAFTSCEKSLQEVVYSSLTDDTAFTTGENANAAVNSMYSPLHLLYREPLFYINDIASDTGFKNGSSFEVMNQEAIYNDGRTQIAWDSFYQIASRANIVLDNVPDMPDGLFRDGLNKERMVAEAHFMRAFAYYNLTDVFYQVPLITSSRIDVASKPDFSGIDEIETTIESDLLEALKVLPKSYSSHEDAQRPTLGAAEGYLCRLYMRQAGRLRLSGGEDSEKWSKALEHADKVLAMEGSEYSLQPKVWNVFDPASEAGLYNNELIFAVRASGTITSGSWDLGLQFTPWSYDMGWGNMNQSLNMTWKFDTDDERYKVLQVTEFPDIYKPTETYNLAPKTINDMGLANSNHIINGNTYLTVNELAETYTKKYKFLNTWKYIYNTPNNMPLLRLSDIILCKAEILNELNGPNQETIDLINRIRTRAFQSSSHNLALASFSTKEDLRQAICDERMFELNMECVRRPDLIRMGLWSNTMKEYINTVKKAYKMKAQNEGRDNDFYADHWAAYPDVNTLMENDIRRYMPIPYREVLLNNNLSGARNF